VRGGGGMIDIAVEEFVCESVAADLLMPHESFMALARRLRPSLEAISELGRTFGASVPATVRRLIRVRPWVGTALVLWEPREDGGWHGRGFPVGPGGTTDCLRGLTSFDLSVDRAFRQGRRTQDLLVGARMESIPVRLGERAKVLSLVSTDPSASSLGSRVCV
jgi:hypothetical protein